MKYDFTTLINRREMGSAKWNGMLRKKPDVSERAVPLSVADMEFVNPPQITEGLKKFLDHAVLGYTAPTAAYFDAVIDWMKRRKNWDVKAEEIICTPGVIPALFASVKAFTEPGDPVLVITPAYPPFYNSVCKTGRRVVTSSLVCTDGRYHMNLADMEEKIAKEKIPLMILCNPNNPTGRCWNREELEQVGELCLKYGVKVISDEIHGDLIMPGVDFTVFASIRPEFADITVTCTAPSKTFNLAGMQVSNIVISNTEMRDQFHAAWETTGSSMLNILGYEACRIAYTECEDWLEELLTVIWENHLFVKQFCAEKLPQVKVFDLEGTYLQWMDFNAYGLDKEELERKNVEEAEAFLDEGYIFGEEGSGFERVNLACPRWVLEETLERIHKAFA